MCLLGWRCVYVCECISVRMRALDVVVSVEERGYDHCRQGHAWPLATLAVSTNAFRAEPRAFRVCLALHRQQNLIKSNLLLKDDLDTWLRQKKNRDELGCNAIGSVPDGVHLWAPDGISNGFFCFFTCWCFNSPIVILALENKDFFFFFCWRFQLLTLRLHAYST